MAFIVREGWQSVIQMGSQCSGGLMGPDITLCLESPHTRESPDTQFACYVCMCLVYIKRNVCLASHTRPLEKSYSHKNY